MVKNYASKAYLTPKEAAEFLNVSTETIRVWSNKGKLKSTITLGGHRRFKLEDLENFSRQIQSNQSGPESDNALKILIIEDDAQYSKLLYEIIKDISKDISVEIAHDGFEAGVKMARFNPAIILLDLVMSGINGIQICRQVKSNPATSHTRIISITGHNSKINAQNLLNAGAETILEKPVEKEQLRKLLLTGELSKPVSHMLDQK